MKYAKRFTNSGTTQLLVNEKINPYEFRSLMMEIASTLRSKVEWVTMPEAEVGKIKLSTGEIHAKLDLEYGLDIDCDQIMDYEILQIEAALSEK